MGNSGFAVGRDGVAKHEFIALLPIPRHKDQPGILMFGWLDVAEGDKFNSRWQRHRNASVSDPTLKGSNILPQGCATRSGSEPFPSIPVALPPAIEFVASGDWAIIATCIHQNPEEARNELPTK